MAFQNLLWHVLKIVILLNLRTLCIIKEKSKYDKQYRAKW